MIGVLAEFHFLRPWWLLLLLPLGYLVWRLWRHDPGRGFWEQICDPGLLPFVVVDTGGQVRRRSVLPFVLGGLCAILALAGPTYERVPQPVFRDQAALVLLLDLSSSMSAPDVNPSRVSRARFKIKDLLAGREIGQTALVVFAAQAFTVTPLTDDVKTIESQLAILAPELMPSQGSNIPQAIHQGVELLQQAGFSRGDLLLITDGIHERDIDPALAELVGGEFRLSVLGVGTLAGSPIPLANGGFVTDRDGGIVLSKLTPTTLGQLAQRGRGLYQAAGSHSTEIAALQGFFAAGHRSTEATATDLSASQWREIGPWLLLPVLVCGGLAFRSGALITILLMTGLGHSSPVRAEWFRTPDQAAQRDFRAERYAQAAKIFEDEDWRAASQYRAGKFADTLATLKHAKLAPELYNKGNALARLGRFEAAIETYDQALKLAPELADATYNRDLLREIVNQQHPDDAPEDKQEPPQKKDGNGGEAENEPRDQGEQGQSQADEAGRNTQMRPPSPNEDPAQNDRETEQGKRERNMSSSASPNASSTDAEQQEAAEEQATDARKEAAGDPEKALATEQWLRQIPDDPGGLLRRKFLYQYGRLHDQEPEQAEPW